MKDKIRAWFVSILTDSFTFALKAFNDHVTAIEEEKIKALALREAAVAYRKMDTRRYRGAHSWQAIKFEMWLNNRAERIEKG